MSEQEFHNVFELVKDELFVQTRHTTKPIVVRETCIALAKLALIRQDQLYNWTEEIFNVLYECSRSSNEMISQSGHESICVFIQCLKDTDATMLKVIYDKGVLAHDDKLRVRSMEYLGLMLQVLRYEEIILKGSASSQFLEYNYE
eukprot:UN30860